MPAARFLETRVVEDVAGTMFVAGETYVLPRASVDRWVRRGVAVEVEEPASTAAPAVTPGETVPDDRSLRLEGAENVEIGPAWRSLHWQRLRATAMRLTRQPCGNRDLAVAAIEREVRWRAADAEA